VIPKLVPAENSLQDQAKGRIRISCAAIPFTAEKKYQHSYLQLSTLFVVNSQYPYEVTDHPYYQVSPEHLRLKLKVYNGMSHILKLEGAVVSLRVAGELISLDRLGYKDFLGGMILPGHEMEFEIAGPPVRSLSDNSVIGLFIYDVVADTDAAGNPSKRTSFEWYYTFSREEVVKSELVTTRKIKMTPEEAASVGAPYAGK
jgi:hypothetical protein